MKTFLFVILFIATNLASVGGTVWGYHSYWTDVLYPVGPDRVAEAKKQCEQLYGTQCHLYGGYAPARPIAAPADPSI